MYWVTRSSLLLTPSHLSDLHCCPHLIFVLQDLLKLAETLIAFSSPSWLRFNWLLVSDPCFIHCFIMSDTFGYKLNTRKLAASATKEATTDAYRYHGNRRMWYRGMRRLVAIITVTRPFHLTQRRDAFLVATFRSNLLNSDSQLWTNNCWRLPCCLFH